VIQTRVVAVAAFTVRTAFVAVARWRMKVKSHTSRASQREVDEVARPVVPFAFRVAVPSTVPALAVAWTAAVELETTLPKASCTTTTGCCANTAPAVTVADGAVIKGQLRRRCVW